MENENQKDIIKELSELPKPVLDKRVQQQMLFDIETFSAKNDKRKRWGNRMGKLFVGLGTAVAIMTVSIISLQYFKQDSLVRDRSSSHVEEVQEMEIVEPSQSSTDPIDITLPEHQVALDDLFFTIPDKRENMFIDRRTEGEFTIVDIRDKHSNKLLYRYGETSGDLTEEMVFREITVPNMNTTLRLYVFVEIDKMNGTITKVTKEHIGYQPEPYEVSNPSLYAWSKSGKFPSKLVAVQVYLQLGIPNPSTNMIETEIVNTGHEIGVIKIEE
jgi:hypothetical protein